MVGSPAGDYEIFAKSSKSLQRAPQARPFSNRADDGFRRERDLAGATAERRSCGGAWPTEKSVFLFQKPITDYIMELRNRGAALRFALRQLPNVELPDGDERREFARIREEHVQWFQQQFDVLIPVFVPALALERDIDTHLAQPAHK